MVDVSVTVDDGVVFYVGAVVDEDVLFCCVLQIAYHAYEHHVIIASVADAK